MKIHVEFEPLEDFLDDKPVIDWGELRTEKLEQNRPFTPREVVHCGMIGLGMLIVSAALLVLMFCL